MFHVTKRKTEGVGGDGEEGDGSGGDGPDWDSCGDDMFTAENAMWRGRGNTPNKTASSLGGFDDGPDFPARGGDPRDGLSTADANDLITTGDGYDPEASLYPRTLGSSVSVLDEKDAVLRTGGARFAGEDPVRGRLRATDPFLWMGRLNAGATAISGLIDKADGALYDFDSGSGGGDSVASGEHSSGDRRRLSGSTYEDDVGPSSKGRGRAKKGDMRKRLGQIETTGKQEMVERSGIAEDGSEDIAEGDEEGLDVDAEHVSSRSDATLEQLSSTMSAYSQALEIKRVIAGGMVVEEDEEENSENEGQVSQPSNNYDGTPSRTKERTTALVFAPHRECTAFRG